MEEHISITLSKEEAIVLLEWLARFNQERNPAFVDQAEERALHDLEALLEREIPEVFREDYEVLLRAARAAVRDAHE
jgi:cell wall assembly regulator SMI1